MVVYIIENGCPLCGGDVKGNEKYSYFCKSCNMLFKRGFLAKKKKEELPKEEEPKVIEEIKKVQPPAPTKPAPLPEPEEDFTEDTTPLEEPEEIRFVASAKSNKMHISTCHFLKKIQKENWIHLNSLQEGIDKEYEPCVCIRRRGLMKR